MPGQGQGPGHGPEPAMRQGAPAAPSADQPAVTEAELRAGLREWETRYLSRPACDGVALVDEMRRDKRLAPRPSDTELTGVDGAHYQAADAYMGQRADRWQAVPVVIMTTRAGWCEIVAGFADRTERARWLAGRAAGQAGLLSACTTGPVCRAVREERVLAMLIQGGDAPTRWRPDTCVADTRTEIFLAWREAAAASGGRPDPGQVEDRLARRLLRAPPWAAEHIGPGGQTAIAYLRRLAQTRVPAADAREAGGHVLAQDVTAHRNDVARASVSKARQRAGLSPFPPGAGRWMLNAPPGHYPTASGPVPRR